MQYKEVGPRYLRDFCTTVPFCGFWHLISSQIEGKLTHSSKRATKQTKIHNGGDKKGRSERKQTVLWIVMTTSSFRGVERSQDGVLNKMMCEG